MPRHACRYHKGAPPAAEPEELQTVAAAAGVNLNLFLDMANTGRGEHSCALHIAQNYEQMADITLFTKDTAAAHGHLGIALRLLAFSRHVPSTDFWCARPPSLVDLNFALPSYKSESCWRHGHCYDNESFALAAARPFGRWLDSMGIAPIGPAGFAWVCYGGFFAASRKVVHASPRVTYTKLVEELSVADSLEAGHYLERAWPSLFRLAHHPRPRYVRVAFYLTACGGRVLPSGMAGLPTEGRHTQNSLQSQLPLAYWPGDTCDSTACQHTDTAPSDVRQAHDLAAPSMLQFLLFSDDGRELAQAAARGWNASLLPREACTMRSLKMVPHRLEMLADFDYTIFLAPDADLKIADLVNVITTHLASLAGPSVALVVHRHPSVHSRQKYPLLRALVRRENAAARAFGERWFNLSNRRAHTQHDERIALEQALRDAGSRATRVAI